VASAFAHEPVLLDESIRHLQLQPGSVVVDGTVGGGGHGRRILEEIGERGRLIGLDRDPQALAAAQRRLERAGEADPRVRLVHASFRDLDQVVRELGLESVDAVLLDLGVSSHQLDAPGRGFRFGESDAQDVPLDMRMDPGAGPSAAELLRRASAEELERWFREYGELPGARRLARAIAERRRDAPLRSSADLLRLIGETRVGRGRRHHPATLVFQALRIAVNDELSALREGLEAAVAVLRPGGRLVVIAYHSLEDRIVKRAFRAAEKGCICPPRAPVCTCGHTVTLRVLTKRPLRPGAAEIRRNPRARSARLRAAERVGSRAA
jgi:16S rRNA (cytosine1402-N4)-methyltransferase